MKGFVQSVRVPEIVELRVSGSLLVGRSSSILFH